MRLLCLTKRDLLSLLTCAALRMCPGKGQKRPRTRPIGKQKGPIFIGILERQFDSAEESALKQNLVWPDLNVCVYIDKFTCKLVCVKKMS